jgi:hypothetical protein
MCEFAGEKCDWPSKSPAAKIGMVVLCLGPAGQNGRMASEYSIKNMKNGTSHPGTPKMERL